jgi:hypothetical protein
MQDQLIRQIRVRLMRFQANQDPDAVLASQALVDLNSLLKATLGPTINLPIYHLAGWLHWARYLALGPASGEPDLSAALALLAPVFQVRPDMVPDLVRDFFDQDGPGLSNPGPMEVARAAALVAHARRTSDLSVLNAAIDLIGQPGAAAQTGSVEHRALLANALRIRYEHTRQVDDLTTAIAIGQDIIAAMPHEQPNYAARLSELGLALRLHFERTGILTDLDRAIDVLHQAVEDTTTARPDHLSNLGNALCLRFARTGTLADLDTAIDLLRQAADSTPADHAGYKTNLAGALARRFERTGALEDLNAAIDAAREAVAATPTGHPARPLFLSNLCATLRIRFEWAGAFEDLNDAIDAGQQAVDTAPVGHPDRAMYLNTLCGVLRYRFERAGNIVDLEVAIGAGRAAVDATPSDHPARAGRLSSLSGALETRFMQTRTLPDLDAAVSFGRQAVDATPSDHPSRAIHLANLSQILRSRFELSETSDDLSAAIDAGRAATAATPTDHPSRAIYLSALASALHIRFERTGHAQDLAEAIRCFREAAQVVGAPTRKRIGAAAAWGRTAAVARQWDEGVAGYTAATELMSQLAPRSLDRDDQEHLLAELGSLSADAAACCIHAGHLERAIELFEAGRAVLLGQALDTRTDLADLAGLAGLAGQHPDLAAEFTRLSTEIDQPRRRGADGITGDQADRGRAAGAALDALIDRIRRQPGFTRFLRPPLARDLQATASAGPVVIVAVSPFGSHALILTPTTIRALPLPGLTPQAVLDQMLAFRSTLQTDPAHEKPLEQVLVWLWDQLAAPVLDQLGFISRPSDGERWPRLWWCVSGLLSFLPIHAAGRHHTRFELTPATVLDRVISSTIPSLRTLAHARTAARGCRGPSNPDRLIAIAMPNTPGLPGLRDLPQAASEVDDIRRQFPGQVDVLIGPQATRAGALAALPTARWAHFACHAHADLDNPSHSLLLLHDHQTQPLTALDISRLRLTDAHLAFLSACDTARPSRRLTDEAIHLASAFHLAGYPHVIATLWPIDDRLAPALTETIYHSLIAGHSPAEAVHRTITDQRNYQPRSPSQWASHLHTGA